MPLNFVLARRFDLQIWDLNFDEATKIILNGSESLFIPLQRGLFIFLVFFAATFLCAKFLCRQLQKSVALPRAWYRVET